MEAWHLLLAKLVRGATIMLRLAALLVGPKQHP